MRCESREFLRSVSVDDVDLAESPCHGGPCVVLNVYDLGEDWIEANDMFSEFLQIGGAFHTGVEVYGYEWTFGCEGVSCGQPRSHDVHVYRQSVVIGVTRFQPAEVIRIIREEMLPIFDGNDYHLLRKNCCSFANQFCQRIVGQGIPAWVDRFPKVAKRMSGSLPRFVGGSVAKSGSGTGTTALATRELSLESDLLSTVSTVARTPQHHIEGPGFGSWSDAESPRGPAW